MKKTKEKNQENKSNVLYKIFTFLIIVASCYFLPSLIIVNNWKITLGILTIILSFVSAIKLMTTAFSEDYNTH
jgi:hypothetical protein